MEQKLKLLRRCIKHLTVYSQLISCHINWKLVILDFLYLSFTWWLTYSSVNSLYSCDNFLCIERLYDVVVSSKLQTKHLIKCFYLCGYHDDRHVGLLSYLTAYLPAVYTRQHNVKQYDVRLKSVEFYHCFLTVMCKYYSIALLFKVKPEQLADVLIIVYYQYSSKRHISSSFRLFTSFHAHYFKFSHFWKFEQKTIIIQIDISIITNSQTHCVNIYLIFY